MPYWTNETASSAAVVIKLAATNVETAAEARAVRDLADFFDDLLDGEKMLSIGPNSPPMTMREFVDSCLTFLEGAGLNLGED